MKGVFDVRWVERGVCWLSFELDFDLLLDVHKLLLCTFRPPVNIIARLVEALYNTTIIY